MRGHFSSIEQFVPRLLKRQEMVEQKIKIVIYYVLCSVVSHKL